MCPKNSLAAISFGMAPQSTAINGPSFRELFSCILLEVTSFPVPLSPVIKTVKGVGAIKSIYFLSCNAALLSPQKKELSASSLPLG